MNAETEFAGWGHSRLAAPDDFGVAFLRFTCITITGKGIVQRDDDFRAGGDERVADQVHAAPAAVEKPCAVASILAAVFEFDRGLYVMPQKGTAVEFAH